MSQVEQYGGEKGKDVVLVNICPFDSYGECWANWEKNGRKEEERCAHDMPAGIIYLPHSCQEWIIGGVDEARRMIRDLERAIAVLEDVRLDTRDMGTGK